MTNMYERVIVITMSEFEIPEKCITCPHLNDLISDMVAVEVVKRQIMDFSSAQLMGPNVEASGDRTMPDGRLTLRHLTVTNKKSY